MYEDSWYSYVPQEKNDATTQSSKHNRRESLLKQTNVCPSNDHCQHLLTAWQGSEPITDSGTILDIYEESPDLHGPPQATLARRAKSYSDFYDVAMSFLSKKIKTEESRDVFHQENASTIAKMGYEDLEDEILDGSQEDYQCVMSNLERAAY